MAVVVDTNALLLLLDAAIAAIAATATTPAPIAARVPTDMPAALEVPAAPAGARGPPEAGAVVCAMTGAAMSMAITVLAAIIRLDLRMLIDTP